MSTARTAEWLLSRSLKNTLWNVLTGVWLGTLILVSTPWYVALLGLEGYGVLSLWLMLQVVMALFDMGLGATLTKQFADSRRMREAPELMGDLLRTVEIIYWLISLMLAVALLIAAGWLSSYWLKPQELSRESMQHAIAMMAIALGLQFPCALYLQGLAGLQAQGRMNCVQILGHSVRYGAGVAVLLWRPNLVWFFLVQAVVAAFQTAAARTVVWRMIPGWRVQVPRFRKELVQECWRFSAGMALTSISAVLLANVDRLALSKMVPTAELGRYAIAFTATGILQLGIQPFYRAFFPRYAELVASGDSVRLQDEYFRSCRLAALVIIPCAVVAGVFAPELFKAWLNRHDETIVHVFRLLLIGITAAGLMWLPAAFQQAHGWTRLHLAMLCGALFIGTPVMVWAIHEYGIVGATFVWALHGISDITLGLWLMHKKLLIGRLSDWYRLVPTVPLVASLALACLSLWLLPDGLNRWESLAWIAATGIIVLASAIFMIRFQQGPRVAA